MPTQNRSDRQAKKIDKQVSALDRVAKRLLASIDPGFNERELLSAKDRQIQNILDGELTLAKGVSGGSIIDFATTMASSKTPHQKNDGLSDADPFDIFTKDLNSIFGYYQAAYQNKYLELSDLKFISKFIPALGEAVKTTLDSIVSSDDMSTTITRNIVLGANLSEDEKTRVMHEVERIEREEKLLKRLRNTVYKKALITGQHYVYCPSYKKIFEEYDRLLKAGRIKNGQLIQPKTANQRKAVGVGKDGFNLQSPAKEAAEFDTSDWTVAQEAVSMESMSAALESSGLNSAEASKVVANLGKTDFHVTTVRSTILTEALEAAAGIDFYQHDLSGYANTFGGIGKLSDDGKVTSDGTVDLSEAKGATFNTAGTYIKYIDASRVVPVKVYNQIIGYFYVHDMSASKKASAIYTQQNALMGSTSLFAGINMKDDKKDNAVRAIVDAITDGILTNFSNTFVNNNQEYKKLIADCIISNGLITNEMQIQFIPATDMIAFVVNEDDDGFGQSILTDSLFPGRLLLDLLVSKLLLYMNKSGSKTYAYVKKGPIDVNSANHTQRVLRQLQEQNITFGDLLSTQMAFSKFAPYGNIQLPTARNGDHLVDFEIQEGQNIDLKTDMEDWLEKMAIMGSGVPSVILEYTDAADFSKSLVTANIKFAGRVSTLQSDLEDPTTDLYKRLLENSNLDDDLKNKAIPTFEFKLPRPRVNANANLSDYLSTVQQMANTLADIMMGTDETAYPNFGMVKEELVRQIIINYLPFVNWNDNKEMLNAAVLAVAEKIKEKDKVESGGNADDLAVDDALMDEEDNGDL